MFCIVPPQSLLPLIIYCPYLCHSFLMSQSFSGLLLYRLLCFKRGSFLFPSFFYHFGSFFFKILYDFTSHQSLVTAYRAIVKNHYILYNIFVICNYDANFIFGHAMWASCSYQFLMWALCEKLFISTRQFIIKKSKNISSFSFLRP